MNKVRKGLLAAVCVTFAMGTLAVDEFSFSSGPSVTGAKAQNNNERPAKPETRKSETLSAAAGPIYTKAVEALQAEPPQYQAALAAVTQIINGGSKFKQYDIVKSREIRGYIRAGQDNYKAAIPDFKFAVDSGILSPAEELGLRYNLAQLYLATQQYRAAIREFEAWFRQAENPQAEAYFKLAQAYYVAGQPSKAIPPAETGYRIMKEPKEDWMQLLASIYIDRRAYSKAAPVLERLIGIRPDKRIYFSQLRGVYVQLGKERDAFAVLAIAHRNGILNTESDLKGLAGLYRANGYPYKAGKILEQGINAGHVKANKDNLEELGNAWTHAREAKKAIPPLTRAAGMSGDGKIHYRLCQNYFADENWSEAAKACNSAVAKGGLRNDLADAYFLMGTSHYNVGKDGRQPAIAAFEKCQENAVYRVYKDEEEDSSEQEGATEDAPAEEAAAEEAAAEEEAPAEAQTVSAEAGEGEEEELSDEEKKMSQTGETCIRWVDHINKEIKVEIAELDREKREKERKEREEEERRRMIERATEQMQGFGGTATEISVEEPAPAEEAPAEEVAQ